MGDGSTKEGITELPMDNYQIFILKGCKQPLRDNECMSSLGNIDLPQVYYYVRMYTLYEMDVICFFMNLSCKKYRLRIRG